MTEVPQLAIIVPVLDEAPLVEAFWTMLAHQQGIAFEVLFVDGGSQDGTLEALQVLAARRPDLVRVVPGQRGRARQLNLGAAQTRAAWLLFLHIDSCLTRSDQLALALTQMQRAVEEGGHNRIAGHFPLSFAEPKTCSPLGYYYYEAKARLNRPGCTHGDQGFFLSRDYFGQVGPFEESLPLLEDTRLAERVRAEGHWELLPGELLTSPRRFEVEGLWQRQVLNSLIMNFAAQKWLPFFDHLPGLYRSQNRSQRLRLTPIFSQLRALMAQLTWRQRMQLWAQTGAYVRSQGWQPAFALDVRRNFHHGLPVGCGETPWLDRWDRWFDPLTDHGVGRWAAAFLVWCWFELTRRWCRQSEGKLGQSTPSSQKESP